MKRKTTWIGKRPIVRKAWNKNIIHRENYPGQWLDRGNEGQREVKKKKKKKIRQGKKDNIRLSIYTDFHTKTRKKLSFVII